MPHWLASERREQASDFVTRFDPRFWTVNFPRPAMACVTSGAADALRVDAVFYREGDLVGLIWEAADRFDHPLLAYETSRDFRGCRLRFRWRSGGVVALDAVDGAVLTVEGRDEGGAAFTAYVRLWNHAVGGGEDAVVALDFADLRGGFAPGGAAVWMGDVDRMFVSLAPPGYVAGSTADLSAPAEGWAELSGIACDGPGAVLAIGDVVVPPHRLGIASGYDDSYHLTPARLLRNALQLGYRGAINHYVGMSHYFRLIDGLATASGGVLNTACAAWHRDFAEKARALGYGVIWSLSYELFDEHCPPAWKQRAADGSPALTGWAPPSTLLSPANAEAMGYLHQVAAAFMGIAVAAGLEPKFQVGEPWWWTMPAQDGSLRPCLYDDAAVAAFAPVAIPTVRGSLSAAQKLTLDAAGACLARSTAALTAAAKVAAPECVTHLLTYLPTVLDRAAPELRRANMPVGWASPAFDVLQLEDYDWVTAGDTAATREGIAAVVARLGYAAADQHYLSGFVLQPEDAAQWDAIVAAADAARARGVAAVFLWALPQVLRDGLLYWEGESDVQAFDDTLFPLALGREAAVAPSFSTAVIAGSGGAEQRQANWAEARTSYDVGPGVRSEADIAALLRFFRARMGPARGFRLRDPFDAAGDDETLGTGDGVRRRFALVKHYGEMTRRITRPVAGSVSVAVDGVATSAFAVEPGGFVVLDTAPAAGKTVRASFGFDVPVRFAGDRLEVSLATWAAGEAVSVPLVEVRE